MAHPTPFFELGQQSMFRIIRSARSRLSREHSADDENAGPRPSGPNHSKISDLQHQLDRPVKRASTARTSFGGVPQHRLTRSRSSLDAPVVQAGSENAAPEKAQQPLPQGRGVLGDVTNNAAAPAGQGAGSSPTANGAKTYVASRSTQSTRETSAQILSAGLSDALEADVQHAEDPQQVMEYLPDIFNVLLREEAVCASTPNYMETQTQVNTKMRGILVDWLVSVQQKYKMKAETLFLAVGILDRYLEVKSVARKHLQLVGVTGMLIAAKFEEVYPPRVHDFVYVTDKAYSRDDIIQMEVSILTALDFKICRPTPMQFLERYQVVNGCTDAHRDLAQYLLELTLVDYKMLKYSPSRLAASSILLSNKLLRRQPSWTPAAAKHTHFTEQMLKECAKELCGLLEVVEHSPLQAVRKKFSQLKYHSVAKLTFVGASAPALPSATDEQRNPRRSAGGVPSTEDLRACRRSAGSVGQRGSALEPPLAPRRSIGGDLRATDMVAAALGDQTDLVVI